MGESGLKMLLTYHPLHLLSTDPVAFHGVLKGIFMENGAAIIEREIARRLLDNMESGRQEAGRLRRLWLGKFASQWDARGKASSREKKVLSQFLALAAVPVGHPSSGGRDTASIEITSMNFASAFKKGR